MKVREMIEFLKLCDPEVQVCWPFHHTDEPSEKAEPRVVENIVQCRAHRVLEAATPYRPLTGRRKQQVRVVVVCPTITMVDEAEMDWRTIAKNTSTRRTSKSNPLSRKGTP
jgi:hypothetical protein